MMPAENSVSEEICRCYFEQIFGYKFIKIRPDWLKSDKNHKMELDGYCHELGIAFEHNGRHHYVNTKKELERCQIRDNLKKEICQKLGIKLIVIPILFRQVKVECLKKFIQEECIKLNIDIPSGFDDLQISI